MSRLIDADVIPYLYPVDDDGNEGDGMTLQSTIDEVPTVKAIPLDRVEQIRAEIDKLPIYIAKFTDCAEIHICKDSVLEIIDKALKEQNE